MKIKNSTGSCLTTMGVPRDHQVGIMWAPCPDGSKSVGKFAGFVYDEDELERAEVFRVISSYCRSNGLKFFPEEQNEPIGCIYEEISQDEFLNRFGDYPAFPGVFFDEGGAIQTAKDTFMVSDASVFSSNAVHHKSMRSSAVAAASLTVVALVVIIFVITLGGRYLAATSGIDLDITTASLAVTIFAGIGLAALFIWVTKITALLYRHFRSLNHR